LFFAPFFPRGAVYCGFFLLDWRQSSARTTQSADSLYARWTQSLNTILRGWRASSQACRASLVRGAGGDGSGCGAYGEPFGRTGYAVRKASALGGADGFVAFFG
jgi:hypothetical protein